MATKSDLLIDRELAEARDGLRVGISAKAAARLLGVHVSTLGDWRTQSPPKGPGWTKGTSAGGGSNQRVLYDYQGVVDWARERFDRSPKEQRLLDELRQVRERAREAELELLVRRERARLRRLTGRHSRKTPPSQEG